MFNKVVGQVEVLAWQVNFRGSLSRSASNVLEPMLLLLNGIIIGTVSLWYTLYIPYQIYLGILRNS